ncbi:hypothetical protein GBAR_LOCUS4345, partial [Geodia barretti]
KGLLVEEIVELPVGVQVLGRTIVYVGNGETSVVALKGALDDSSAEQVLHLDPGHRGPLLHLVALIVHHHPRRPVQLYDQTTIQIAEVNAHADRLSEFVCLKLPPYIGCLAQRDGAAVSEDDDVLDTHAAPAGEVNARLYGEHGIHVQRVGGTRTDPRDFVDRQAHAVPKAVAKVVTVPGVGYDVSGQLVRLLPVHADLHVLDRRKLRVKNDVVNLVEHLVRLAHNHSAGNVGAVAADLGAHVDDDGFTALDDVVSWHVVGHGPIGSGGHDGVEADTIGSGVPHGHLHPPRHFPLGHAFCDSGAYLFHRQVRGVDGPLQQYQLIGILEAALVIGQVGEG